VTAAVLRWEMNAEKLILLTKHLTRQSAMPLVKQTTYSSQRLAKTAQEMGYIFRIPVS
jgi:hypothetical protein